jgi:hypothetical protein
MLKLRLVGTQRVQMKGVLPWLVRWACRAGTRYFCAALAALVGPMHNIFFLTVYYFIHSSRRPASCSGSRAGSPVSKYVSLAMINGEEIASSSPTIRFSK